MNKKLITVITLSVSMGMSSAWALTEDQAKAKVADMVAGSSALKEDGKSQVQALLSKLIAQGVPVDQAYEVAKVCAEQGIQGDELTQLREDLTAKIDAGMNPSASAGAIMEDIENYTNENHESEMRQAMQQEMMDPVAGEFAQDRDGFGGGAGAGGNDFGTGVGAGANDFGAGAGGSDFGAGGGAGATSGGH